MAWEAMAQGQPLSMRLAGQVALEVHARRPDRELREPLLTVILSAAKNLLVFS